MTLTKLLILFAGIPSAGDMPQPAVFYQNYHQGLQAARAGKKPLLVILNPGPQWEGNALTVEGLRKTRERRGLLKNYVVVVIDATTRHGEIVHRAYAKPKLPHVVVLGKRQSYQIFTTSEKLYGQRWTEILKKYKTGEQIPLITQRVSSFCPT